VTESLSALLIAVLLAFCSYWIIDTAYEGKAVTEAQNRPYYPSIPRCDKPLWDRIRHLC